MSAKECICCNLGTYNVGCLGHCENIKLPLIAPADGDYKIMWYFNGNKFKMTVPFTTNDEIIFSSRRFNEVYEHKVQVINPDGDIMVYEDTEGVEYDCFTFKITPVNHV